jgi:uncharacterized protein YcfJ
MKLYAILGVSLLLAGCATGGEKQTAGTLLGGAAGALVGSQIGGGSGQIVGTAVGAVGGAIAGGMIGKSMDDQDKKQ